MPHDDDGDDGGGDDDDDDDLDQSPNVPLPNGPSGHDRAHGLQFQTPGDARSALTSGS